MAEQIIKRNVEKMILELFPDAIPDKDFSIQLLPDNTVAISNWNAFKLGTMPELTKMHTIYMRRVKRRKELMPDSDDTDPLPYLSAKPEEEKSRRASESQHTAKPEIFNGLVFTRIR